VYDTNKHQYNSREMYVYSFKSMNITDGEVNGSENPNIWVYWVCILSVFKKRDVHLGRFPTNIQILTK